MKLRIVLPVIVFSLVLVSCVTFAESKRNTAFDTFKSLEGNWIGEWVGGSQPQVKSTFKLMSGGTSMMQTISDFHGEMVSTFYADGNHLMMTHYCNANNQPRLRSNSAGVSKEFTFSFVDATNLGDLDEGHINKLVMTFESPDRIRQDWTWREKGASRSDTLVFQRAK